MAAFAEGDSHDGVLALRTLSGIPDVRKVVVTRSKLATWWDREYDDEFSWNSERGKQCYDVLRQKNLVVLTSGQSEYSKLRTSTQWAELRGDRAISDAPLTELGKLQAAGLATKLAFSGFRPQLILSSPLTRSLQTATFAFPKEFVDPATPATCNLKTCKLLSPAVDSWGDCEREIDDVVAARPELTKWQGSMTRSRFQRVRSVEGGEPLPRRWQLVTSDARTGAALDAAEVKGPRAPFPQEPRANARKRAALLWRLLSENRPEKNVAVFTHGKLITEDRRPGHLVGLLGPGIEDLRSEEIIMVLFEN